MLPRPLTSPHLLTTPSIPNQRIIALCLVPAGIVVMNLIASAIVFIPNQPAVLLALVVFSALLGEVLVGLFSAAVMLVYSAWLLNGIDLAAGAIPFFKDYPILDFLALSGEATSRLIVYVLVAPCMAVAAGVVRSRLLQESRHRAKSENFSEQVFSKSAVGIVYADLTGTIIRCNSTFASLVGRSIDRIEGQHFENLIFPDDVPSNRAAVKDLLAGREYSVTLENRYVRPDGRPVWVRKIANLARGADGKPAYIMVFARDISADKAKDAKLIANERLYSSIWQHAPLANLIVVTPNMKIAKANDMAMAMFEMKSSADVQSFSLFALSADSQIDADASGRRIQAYLQDLWREGTVKFDWVFRSSSGRQIPCVVSMVRISVEGTEGAYVMLQDVTDSLAQKTELAEDRERLAEQVRERTREVEDLLHEFEVAQSIGSMGSFSADLTTGKFSCSSTMARLFELGAFDDLVAEDWLCKVHVDDRQLVLGAWTDAVESGADYDIIYRIVTSSGTRYIRGTARFYKDGSDRPVRAVGTGLDVSALVPPGYTPGQIIGSTPAFLRLATDRSV